MSVTPEMPWYELQWYDKSIKPNNETSNFNFSHVIMSYGGNVDFGVFQNSKFKDRNGDDVNNMVTYWAYYPDAPDTNK